jgi:hypothetical protein
MEVTCGGCGGCGALRTSGDCDDYWRFHLEREHARNYPDAKAA